MASARSRVGAWLDSYRTDLRTALFAAQRHGYPLIQANTVGTELNPSGFGTSARRHFARYLRDLGLQLDALAVEFPGGGLAEPHDAGQRIEHLRRTLELCRDMKVTRAAVRLTGLDDERRGALSLEMLENAADLADRIGVGLSVHPGLEPPEATAEAIARVGCPLLGVVADAATWTPAADAALGGRIGDAFVRDARGSGGRLEETDFGAGEVDFSRFLGALAEGEYHGPLIVRRDSLPADDVDALRRGREYVAGLLSPAESD